MKLLFLTALSALLTIPLSAVEKVESPQGSVTARKEAAAVPEKDTAALKVCVTGVKNSKGNILVSLFNQSDGFPSNHKKAFRSAVMSAKGLAEIEFDKLPRGTYAVAVCHDENGSLKLETGFFGKPKEGVGTSNNVIKKMRPPTFAEASFKILEATRQIKINIHY